MIALTAVSFVALLLLAVPVAYAVGMAAFIGLWWSGAYPLTIIIQQVFLSVDSFVLLAIPLFILAGALMETGGIAVRLVRFAQALIGWIRGGVPWRSSLPNTSSPGSPVPRSRMSRRSARR